MVRFLAAQAAGTGEPVIRYPVDGGGVTVNGTYYVEIGFEDAPVDVYTITANALDGTVLDSSTFDSSTASSRGLEFGPLTELGDYFLRVLRSDGSVAAESRFSADPRDPRPANPEITGAEVASREATLSWVQRPDPGIGPLTGFEVQLDRFVETRQVIAPSSTAHTGPR